MTNLKVLCVGLCYVDTVQEVDVYQKEDSCQRATSHQKQRGGNASNTSTVLGLLGAKPYYFGVLADSYELNFLKQDFSKYGVNVDLAVVEKGYICPTAYVILSAETGSRTIIHYNPNLQEVTIDQFEAIDLRQFSWIHFEGRNIQQVYKMVQHVRNFCSETNLKITISIEIERTRINIESIIPLADVLFLSRDFAVSMDWHNMEDAVSEIYKKFKIRGATICAWAEKGAAAKLNHSSPVYSSKSFPPDKIVDTLGAGDTFVAGTIYALNNGRSLNDSVTFGCKVAGAKIGHKGWSIELKELFQNIF